MSNTDNNIQSKKGETSRLALASFVIPALMWDIGWLLAAIPLLIPSFFNWLSTEVILFFSWLFLSALLILLSSPIGIILAAFSLIFIRKSGGKLEGKRTAIKAIILSVILCLLSVLLGSVFLKIILYWRVLGALP